MAKPLISVIVPAFNEEKAIAHCLESVLRNQRDDFDLEIVVVDGMSKDATCDIIKELQKKHSNIRLFENPEVFTPHGMNIGIQRAKGDYILIASSHSSFNDDYISVLYHYIQHAGVDVAGGMMETRVLHSTRKSESIVKVLSHPLGVGNAMFRTGVKEAQAVDTVPFGLYKKEVFDKAGLYNEKLIRNQDIELSKRIARWGFKIHLVPDARCYYYARENFASLGKNNYANGKWNLLTIYYTKAFKSLSLRHFIPLIFLLSLILPLVAASIYLPLGLLSAVSLLTYMGAILLVSVKINNAETSLVKLVSAFITLHISYGLGSLSGLLSWIPLILKRQS